MEKRTGERVPKVFWREGAQGKVLKHEARRSKSIFQARQPLKVRRAEGSGRRREEREGRMTIACTTFLP